jgi:hypothetical protein
MEIVNLTPHAIVIYKTENTSEQQTILLPSGIVARCVETTHPCGELELDENFIVPIIRKSFGAIQGLPEPRTNTFYIVSSLVAQAAWALGRADVLCPGDIVRNENGQVIGCKSLCRG